MARQIVREAADMSETHSEMRSLRADVRALREEVASRAYVDARAAETETLIESLFGRINERLERIETLLATGR